MNSKLLHTPVGVRDIYNDECYDKLLIQNRIHKIFKEYGYSDIQTPTFEFFDIFNKERGSVASKNMQLQRLFPRLDVKEQTGFHISANSMVLKQR